ncbi:hypothetical protein [Streptomyces sp. DSM 40907]|uniref:hypothetical protein n=1 Tax=Streptomyces kutzneri TaxID=3051179 RepID=UPI0028D0FF7F|nr:hypothetical protein [Streptomyces sp. DSM 40907]
MPHSLSFSLSRRALLPFVAAVALLGTASASSAGAAEACGIGHHRAARPPQFSIPASGGIR